MPPWQRRLRNGLLPAERVLLKIPTSTRYESAVVGALSYHCLFVILGAVQLIRLQPDGRFISQALDASGQSLVAFSAVFCIRYLTDRFTRRADAPWALIATDIVFFLLGVAILSIALVPSDSSGAALLGIIYLVLIGTPVVVVTSALSLFVETRAPAIRFLLLILFADVVGWILLGALHVRLA